jgi:hypothetical protein
MKKILIIVFLIAAVLTLNAQGFSYGPQIGISSTSVIEKSALGDVEKNVKMGYQIGVAAEFEVMSFLYVGGAISFFEKGDKIKNDFGTFKTKIGYIDVPLTIGYKMPIGNLSVFGNVGPYTSIAIIGKSVMHSEFMDETHPIEIGGDFGYYKRFDTGVTFGGGLEFKQFQIKANYALGFVDITEGETMTSKNSVLNITGTYFIGRNY